MKRRAWLLALLMLPLAALAQSPAPEASLPPYQLLVSGSANSRVDQQLMMNVALVWRRRLETYKVPATQINIRLVDTDNQRDVTAIKPAVVKGGGVCIGLLKTDGKAITQVLECQGPYRPDATHYLGNPSLGDFLDAANVAFGRGLEEIGKAAPWIGVSVFGARQLSLQEQAQYQTQPDGVVIFHVAKGSAGQLAGLREGDEITAVNSQPITTLAEYNKTMAGQEELGRVISFTVRRQARTSTVPVTVKAYP